MNRRSVRPSQEERGRPPDGQVSWTAGERERLVRLCATISGEPAVAEDLAQETLLEAWRHAIGCTTRRHESRG